MRLTIVRDDSKVGIDGVFRHVDLSSLDSNIHAVQWDGTKGHVEYKEPQNEETINSYKARFGAFVDLWESAAPPPAPEETWLDKRIKPVADGGYGTMLEQLEILAEQGIQAFQTHAADVKARHPKED